MSTKIYSGFRFKTNDIFEIQKYIMEFREEVKAHDFKTLCKEIARLATITIDNHSLGVIWGTHRPYRQAIDVLEEIRKEDEISADIVIFPFENSIYGMSFGKRDHNRMWSEKPFVEEFAYWNNTDPLEGVSEEDWKERGRIWDEILVNFTPAESGFTAQCSETYPLPPDLSQVLAEVPSLESRVLKSAKDHLFKIYDQSNNRPLQNYMSYIDWIGSEEGKDKLASDSDLIRSKLRPITEDLLREIS